MELKSVDTNALLTLSDTSFGADVNHALVHQVVTAYFAGARSGTKAQKNRSAVRGGGAKPWRQKGTGRARAGTSRSPLWRSGGVTFAAQPRNYTQKLNKNMYRAGMRSILSELAQTERLLVIEQIDVDEPKTRLIASRLKELSLNSVLIITEAMNENLALAARNLSYVDVIEARQVNPLSLLQFEKVLATSAALKLIEQQLS